ncbi:MAG: glycosyltransferase family 4 protein [Thermoanaerobaculia bacterium]|nr:glycosyltransferase family 4 protein [Thermoanaerobaculia bacterium]
MSDDTERVGLRIALVTTFYPPHSFGGDALFVRTLAHTLARHGHDVEVIYDADAFHALSAEKNFEALPEPSGVRVHRLSSRFPRLAALATHQAGRPTVHRRELQRLLEPGRFDVVHYHNISLVGGPGILAYGDGLKLYTTHEHWLICPTHVLWRHDRELCTEKQCLRCTLHYRRPPQIWRATGLLERALEAIDALCVPTRFTAEMHAAVVEPSRIEVLPLFLPELDDGAPTGAAERERGDYFLYVGRLEKLKGLQTVLPCFGEDSPGELRVAGTGSFEPELERLADPSRVRFLGFVPPDDLTDLYRRARAVIVPSLTYEISPLVVLEAFRAGTPVVARRLGPLPEMVERHEAGLLFENRHELARALRRLGADSSLADRLGENARAAFERIWSEESFLRRYYVLIARWAEETGRRSIVDRLATVAERRASIGLSPRPDAG